MRVIRHAGGLFISLVLAACATTPPGSVYLERATSDLGVVAFAAVQVDPSMKLSADYRGKGGGATAGAGEGVLGCILAGGLWGVIAAPFCAATGAGLGAAVAAPLATLEDAERVLQAQIAATAPQRQLLQYASEYAKASGLEGIAVLPAGKPATPEALPSYSAREGVQADTVLEMTLTQFAASTPGQTKLDYRFSLSARGRLIRVQDNTIVDTFERCTATSMRAYKEWSGNDAKLFKGEIAQAARDLAEGFVDEWLLVYRGPAATPDVETRTPSGKLEDHTDESALAQREVGEVSPYALRPVYRAQEYSSPRFVSHIGVSGNIIESAKLRPTLRWEPLPQSFKVATGKDVSDVSSIVYDLRLYEVAHHEDISPPWPLPSHVGAYWKGGGLLVGSWSGLSSPEFTPFLPLKACSYYHWTVRARFTLNGKTRTSEWGGAADSRRSPMCGGARVYFAFITPNADGTKCK